MLLKTLYLREEASASYKVVLENEDATIEEIYKNAVKIKPRRGQRTSCENCR